MDKGNCSFCGVKIRLIQINFTEAIYTCPNVKCAYPFNDPYLTLNFIKRDFTLMNKEEQNLKENETNFSSVSNYERDDKDYLDNLFANCNSMEMTEDDIQDMDFLFETLQSFNQENSEADKCITKTVP